MFHKQQLLEYYPFIWTFNCINSFVCIWKLLESICGHIHGAIGSLVIVFVLIVEAAFKLHGTYHDWVWDVVDTVLKVGVEFLGVGCVLSILVFDGGFFGWCFVSRSVLVSGVVAGVILIGVIWINVLAMRNVVVCLILLLRAILI